MNTYFLEGQREKYKKSQTTELQDLVFFLVRTKKTDNTASNNGSNTKRQG
jgi:hypothetical protein